MRRDLASRIPPFTGSFPVLWSKAGTSPNMMAREDIAFTAPNSPTKTFNWNTRNSPCRWRTVAKIPMGLNFLSPLLKHLGKNSNTIHSILKKVRKESKCHWQLFFEGSKRNRIVPLLSSFFSGWMELTSFSVEWRIKAAKKWSKPLKA